MSRNPQRRLRALPPLVGAAVAAAAALAGAQPSPSLAAGAPDPSNFSARVDNPWYPLRPGTTYIYRGVKDGEPSRDVYSITHRTTKVEGVPCVVVEDRLFLSGRLEERTTEWYSQDKQGNVWYFGEDTAELDKQAHVKNTNGSWRAGLHGAEAGIFMFASPKVGQTARQEFYKGQAEDHFQVLSLNATAKVPYMTAKHALLTKEWTPLEPRVLDHKVYVRGIGEVLEQSVKGPVERAALVALQRGR